MDLLKCNVPGFVVELLDNTVSANHFGAPFEV